MIKPQVILFDLDNTVYPYDPCHHAGMQRVTEMYSPGLPEAYDAARKAVKRHVGKVAGAHCRLLYFKELIETATGKSDLNLTIELHDAYWEAYFGAMVREPGSKEFFGQLRQDGVKTAWVSDFTTERQIKKLSHLDLLDSVDVLVTSEEAGIEKPDPAGVKLALRRLRAEGLPGWFVGDDPDRDLQPGRACGLETIWFKRMQKEAPVQPDAEVTNWAELKAIYDRL